jgi:hypothetical protein
MIKVRTIKARKDLQAAVYTANVAAHLDSNDDEMEALRDALELALTRWPTIDPDGQRHKHRKADMDEGGEYCTVCGY